MLQRPESCHGCVLNSTSSGFAPPDGRPQLGVALIGEALGESEAKEGRPFVGAAGFRLGKMIEGAGFKREEFLILNAASCRPMVPRPNAEPPPPALDHCRPNWEPYVRLPEVKVIVPMGNTALGVVTGEAGILSKRGYVQWSETYQAYVLPTVHPSFILQGNANWEAAWMYDLRHGVEVAREGWTPVERTYLLDPSPRLAAMWAATYLGRLREDPTCALTADLETPDKSVAEDETDINLGYLPGPIHRIGFAYRWANHTLCLSIPWEPSYLGVIQLLLDADTEIVFCYRHFDVPRIKAHSLRIAGRVHDIQEMWHVLHSDLPKKLEHITPFLVPRQPAWKHLNEGDTRAYYNAVDCGVQIESYWVLKGLLRAAGMWDLYHRHIFQLNEILIYMSEQGMPIDVEKRVRASEQLMVLKEGVRVKLNAAAEGARPTKVYKKFREGLEEVEIEEEERYCSECGKVGVSKTHPCFRCGPADGEVPLGSPQTRRVRAVGYSQPLDFKPSQKGLLRYAKYKGYKILSRWDKETQTRKESMDESAVRKYALAHTDDPIWPLVLEEREIGKLLSTYVGRLVDEPEKVRTDQEAWWEMFRAAQFRVPVMQEVE